MNILVLLFYTFNVFQILQGVNNQTDYDIAVYDYWIYMKKYALDNKIKNWRFKIYYKTKRIYGTIKLDTLQPLNEPIYMEEKVKYKKKLIYPFDYDLWQRRISKHASSSDIYLKFQGYIKDKKLEEIQNLEKPIEIEVSFIRDQYIFLKYVNNELTFVKPNLVENKEIDYVIWLQLRVSNSEISYMTMPYNDDYYLLNICVSSHNISESKSGYLKFIPSPHVSDNGYMYKKDKLTKYYATPIFPMTATDTFFECGKMRQFGTPDISIGFKLEKNIQLLKYYMGDYFNKAKNSSCSIDDPETLNFVFIPIKANKNNVNSFLKDEIGEIFGGKRYTFSFSQLKKDNIYFKGEELAKMNLCVHTFPIKNGVMMPRLENYPQPKLNFDSNKDGFYILSDLYFKTEFNTSCNIQIKGLPANQTLKYFQNVISSAMYKDGNMDIEIKNIKFEKTNYQLYGKYICKINKKAKSFDESKVQKVATYFIPLSGTVFSHNEVKITENEINLLNCSTKTFHDKYELNEAIIINKGNIIFTKKFDQNEFKVNEDYILFKPSITLSNVVIKCIYNSKSFSNAFQIHKSFTISIPVTTSTEKTTTMMKKSTNKGINNASTRIPTKTTESDITSETTTKVPTTINTGDLETTTSDDFPTAIEITENPNATTTENFQTAIGLETTEIPRTTTKENLQTTRGIETTWNPMTTTTEDFQLPIEIETTENPKTTTKENLQTTRGIETTWNPMTTTTEDFQLPIEIETTENPKTTTKENLQTTTEIETTTEIQTTTISEIVTEITTEIHTTAKPEVPTTSARIEIVNTVEPKDSTTMSEINIEDTTTIFPPTSTTIDTTTNKKSSTKKEKEIVKLPNEKPIIIAEKMTRYKNPKNKSITIILVVLLPILLLLALIGVAIYIIKQRKKRKEMRRYLRKNVSKKNSISDSSEDSEDD